MPVELGSFDAIIGMDWLAKYQAVIMCAEKIVRIPWKNKTLDQTRLSPMKGSRRGHSEELLRRTSIRGHYEFQVIPLGFDKRTYFGSTRRIRKNTKNTTQILECLRRRAFMPSFPNVKFLDSKVAVPSHVTILKKSLWI
ncbi:reverse transcriptase domain-containing protein [Tanacetum coccineum]